MVGLRGSLIGGFTPMVLAKCVKFFNKVAILLLQIFNIAQSAARFAAC